jgi:hypothetical protein
VIRLLRSNYNSAQFGNEPLDFQVYVAENFTNPMHQGVSLLLYRIYHNGTARTPPGRSTPLGRLRTRLPLDIHFLLTAWGQTASRQHEIAGWMMRVLEDHPTLPAGLLNAYHPEVFDQSEAVEVTLGELATEDLFRIWEVMISHVYQLSVPYVARVLQIESDELMAQYPSVIEREVEPFAVAWPAGAAAP